jgi:hypothetical protein
MTAPDRIAARWLLSGLPVLCLLALALAFILQGCAPAATVARKDGFNAQWRGFSSIPGQPSEREAVISVRVIVTEDLPPGVAATYSHPQGIIRIRGKAVDGKAVVCESVLGHEVMHALQFQDGGFVNPDELEGMGY